MADGTFGIFHSPEAAYATKTNIRFPGSSTQATAADSTAVTLINDRLPSGMTVSGADITPAT